MREIGYQLLNMEMEKSRPGSQKRVKLEEKTKEKEDEDEKQSIIVIGEGVLGTTEDRKLKLARSPKTNPELVPEVS
ncbi:unnamed protein product [Orchesella dallaii]|uniref:Uncharacterized protein n=1 Tax=Orchesella dallaii TaxID=48710 RepID=A0ABP1S8T5_9HEXA